MYPDKIYFGGKSISFAVVTGKGKFTSEDCRRKHCCTTYAVQGLSVFMALGRQGLLGFRVLRC